MKRDTGRRPRPELVALFKSLPPETRDLTMQARDLLLRTLPSIEETADAKARIIGYGYGPGYKGMVATLILSKKGVKIGLLHGATLPDPEGRLAGAGRVHRHIPITRTSELKLPAVRELIRQALEAWRGRM